MTYDFDRHIDRRGSGALKYDALQERYGDASLLPLWVAEPEQGQLLLLLVSRKVWEHLR